MKLLFKILSLFFLLILITAEDCGNSSPEMTRTKIQREKYQNIEEGFVSNELSRENLKAYEVRAIQKVKDLSDYITIYLNGDLEKEFRQQAKNMIYKTFYTYDNCNQFFDDIALKEDTDQILLFRPDTNGNIIFRSESIQIPEHLKKTEEFEYSGKIDVDASLLEIIENDTIVIDKRKLTLPIVLLKKEKDFGESSEKVWELLLGESQNLNLEL